jgi:hypothetical protein
MPLAGSANERNNHGARREDPLSARGATMYIGGGAVVLILIIILVVVLMRRR